jgi:hypothetical protein
MRMPLLALIFALQANATMAADKPLELVACGWDNLSIFEVRPSAAKPVGETWFWKPQEYEGVPADVYDLYRHIDECKPFDGGDRILITASTDGVGIVDRRNRRFIHIGTARNAHSAEVLPGGRIAVAASTGGDSLIVFEGRAGGKELIRAPLPGGHGVHWDEASQRLYALSETAIKVYALVAWDSDRPDLRLVKTIPLPEAEGHELSRIAGTTRFHVTTATRAWVFDSSDGHLVPHPDLANQAKIKSIATHAETGTLAWLSADPNGWWTYNLRLRDHGRAVVAPVNKRYYKLRWIDGATRRWPDDR